MPRLLSLFDHTGMWSQPFYDAGWDVLEVDIKNWVPLDVLGIGSAEEALDEWGEFDGIIAAPPCTDFANSGAQYWKAKDADGRTQASVELVVQTFRFINLFQPTDPDYYADGGSFFWALENPIGRLPKLVPELGKPRLVFDPCDFGGWLADGERSHDLAPAQDAYTKRTALWGNFVVPQRRRVEPVQSCAQGSWLQLLGGKSEKTKSARSITPLGFARAFYAANGNLTGAQASEINHAAELVEA